MPQDLFYLLYGLGGLVALGGIVGLLKMVDWLISLKYRTKDDCEKCRGVMFKTINADKNLLVEVNAKVTMILEQLQNNMK